MVFIGFLKQDRQTKMQADNALVLAKVSYTQIHVFNTTDCLLAFYNKLITGLALPQRLFIVQKYHYRFSVTSKTVLAIIQKAHDRFGVTPKRHPKECLFSFYKTLITG